MANLESDRPLPSKEEQFDAAIDDYNEGRLTLDGLRAVYAELVARQQPEDVQG